MHMKKKKLLIVVLLSVGFISVYASSHFIFDISELSFISTKKKEVLGYFNKSYQLSSSISGNDAGLEKKIQDLTNLPQSSIIIISVLIKDLKKR